MTIGFISAFTQRPESGTGRVAAGLWDTHLSVGHEYPRLCPAGNHGSWPWHQGRLCL